MDTLDHWKSADVLNIFQIALLLGGFNPSNYELNSNSKWPSPVRDRTNVHITLLKQAILAERLKPIRIIYGEHDQIYWDDTLINMQDVHKWLQERGVAPAGVWSIGETPRALSDPRNAFYAPKLAAAVDAWTAVSADERRQRGKTPKQALEAWLTENAAKYGLLNKDGTPNRTGIEEVAKVANWKPAGGAPATPSGSPEPSLGLGATQPVVRDNSPPDSRQWSEDEDVPF